MSLRASIQLSPSPFASSSRLTLSRIQARLKKTAAPKKAPAKVKSTGSWTGVQGTASAADSRVQIMQRVLYPPDAYNPSSPAPTGSYPPQHVEKLHAVIQHPEVQETIERAWKVYRRRQRLGEERSLQARFTAMQEACAELDRITAPGEDGQRSLYDRQIYDAATRMPNAYKEQRYAQDKRASALAKWKDARVAGLLPREIWVPTETKGSAWKYDWQRPSDD